MRYKKRHDVKKRGTNKKLKARYKYEIKNQKYEIINNK